MIVVSRRSTDPGRATCLRARHPGAAIHETGTLVALPHKKVVFAILSARDKGTVSCLSSMLETLTKIDLELYQRSTAASQDENSSSVLTWLSIHHTPSTPHGPRPSCYPKTQANTISPQMEPQSCSSLSLHDWNLGQARKRKVTFLTHSVIKGAITKISRAMPVSWEFLIQGKV